MSDIIARLTLLAAINKVIATVKSGKFPFLWFLEVNRVWAICLCAMLRKYWKILRFQPIRQTENGRVTTIFKKEASVAYDLFYSCTCELSLYI